jgi:Raf kinase inhibitor-like YbhB/YbcL family protein
LSRLGRYIRVGRRYRMLLAIVLLAPVAGGCGLLGGLTTHRLGSPQRMTVTSPVFSPDVAIPRQYTCHGAGLAPPLYWSGAPQGGSQSTKSFAIVVDDSQAPITPYVYWLAFDISPATSAIPQNELPPGARQAVNSHGAASYDPPCPVGSRHLYRFTVYALNARLNLPPGAGLRATWSAIASHVIGIGRLTAYANP